MSFSTSTSCRISSTVEVVCSWIREPVSRLWLCRGSLVCHDSLSCVSNSHTGSTATTPEQFERHHFVTFNRCSAAMMRNCERRKFVSYPSNLWERIFDLRRSKEFPSSLGINPIDNAEPYHPHDHIVCGHSSDECKKSKEPSVCHKLWSIW